MRVLIVKTGSTVAPLIARRGDFEDWFRCGLGLDAAAAPAVAVHRGEPLPDPAAVPAAVVTGSPSMVTDEAPWSLASERWLREVVQRGVPVLGVCYGHQLLARAFGGEVGDNPAGREIGTVEVELTDAGRAAALFGGLPSRLVVQATHSQSVLRPPPGAAVLAHNRHDACQALALGGAAFGVQFHPEFDADIVRGYLAARAADLRAEGIDAPDLADRARDSDHGTGILRRFLDLVRRPVGQTPPARP